MSRCNPIDYSIEMKDWERLGHGVGHIPGGGNAIAGQEGSRVQQTGYKTYQEGQ